MEHDYEYLCRSALALQLEIVKGIEDVDGGFRRDRDIPLAQRGIRNKKKKQRIWETRKAQFGKRRLSQRSATITR